MDDKHQEHTLRTLPQDGKGTVILLGAISLAGIERKHGEQEHGWSFAGVQEDAGQNGWVSVQAEKYVFKAKAICRK